MMKILAGEYMINEASIEVNNRDTSISDTYINIIHFWRYRIGIPYSVIMRYRNRCYHDVI